MASLGFKWNQLVPVLAIIASDLPDVVSLLDSCDLHLNEIQSYLDSINTDIDSVLATTAGDELRVTVIP